MFVGADAIGAEEIVIGAAVDDETATGVVKADHVFGFNVVGGASVDPLGHVCLS